MKSSDIVNIRLNNHHLVGEKFKSPEEVVAWYGGVQAQDFPAAKWAIGLRLKNASDQAVEQAFNEGRILRTHIMRPTWHFVMPQDLRWMQELTAPRVRSFLAHYDRKLEITPELRKQASAIIAKALRGRNFRTRLELSQELEKNTITARGQRLGHLMIHPELDAVICSGPRRGKQFTYALVEERAPYVKPISRDEALGKLALTYFTSHGPAQLRDFAWWSGLGAKDAALGLASVKTKLVHETVGGKEYWFSAASHKTPSASHAAFLLSIYDEYTIAYNDRSALGEDGDTKVAEKLLGMGNALTAVVILDGKIVGTWKRIFKKNKPEVTLSLMKSMDSPQMAAVSKAEKQYKKFLMSPAQS